MAMTERRTYNRIERIINIFKIIPDYDFEIYHSAARDLSTVSIKTAYKSGQSFDAYAGGKRVTQIIPSGEVAIAINARGDDIDIFWRRVEKTLKARGAVR